MFDILKGVALVGAFEQRRLRTVALINPFLVLVVDGR
jgi:hypothetical protein